MHNHATTQRLRLLSAHEATAAGIADARSLIAAIGNAEESHTAVTLLSSALDEIIGLAVEQRLAECEARKAAFCAVIAPVMADSFDRANPEIDQPATMNTFINVNQRATKADEQPKKGGRPWLEEERVVRAAIYACSQVSAGLVIVASPDDEDSTAILVELQLAVRALEPRFTETEGGEL